MARTSQKDYNGPSKKKARHTYKNVGKVKIYQAVKRALHGIAEAKEVVTDVSTTLNNVTAATQGLKLVSGVAEGTDYNNRVGRKCSHKYCDVSIAITSASATAAAANTGDCGFWSIILDRQPNGSLPAFSDVYETTTLDNGGTALRNTRLYQDRFRVLAHEDWQVGGYGSTAGAGSATEPYRCKRFVDCSKLKDRDGTANFNGTGATIADINEGAIYWVFASTYASTNLTTTAKCQVKYRFTDV